MFTTGAGNENGVLNFGDGTSVTGSNNADATYDNWSCNAAGLDSICAIKHIYTKAGTYTATLTSNGNSTVGTATISVGGTSSVGSLTASNPNPIAYSIVSGASTGVTVGSFTLQPSGENVSLQRIGLDLPAQAALPSDITNAYIYQGSTLVGTAVFTSSTIGTCPPSFTGILSGGCYFATTTISSTLVQNAQTNFIIKADIAPIGVGQAGTSGDEVIIGLSDAQGTGVTSGATIHSGSAPTQIGVRIFKSYPTVTLVPLNATNVDFSVGKQPALLRFSVTASQSGPIGLAYLTPTIVANGITFSSVTTYAYTDPNYSQPVSSTVSANGNLGTVNPSSGLTGSFSIPISNGSVPLEIPAGSTYYFQIVGTTASTQGNVSVTATLPGDMAFVPIGSYNGNVGRFGSNANFVWSPNDLKITLFSDNDWTNGFGISGLPLNGISQTRTGAGAGTQTCPAGTSGTYPNCNATVQNPILTFNAVPTSVTSGASAALDWTASYTGLCTVTNVLTGASLDLSHANDNAAINGYSSVSTGPLSQTTTFELKCAPLTGATSGNAVKDLTVSVTPTPSPNVTYTGISGNTVTGTYANLPANAQIVVVNQTSGQAVSGISMSATGSGTISLGNIPSGAFYLRAQDATTGSYLAQSVVFYSSGPSTPNSCPVYQQQLCPAGQILQIGTVTYDANGCQIPHNSCVPANPVPFPTATVPIITSFFATPSSIIAGHSALLTWSASNATSYSVNGTSVGTANSLTVSPTQSTIYVLTASGAQGTSAQQTAVTVTSALPPWGQFFVGQSSAASVTLTINGSGSPAYVTIGSPITASVSPNGVTSCSLPPFGAIGPTTSTYQFPVVSSPPSSTTYTVTCTTAAGTTVSSSVVVYFLPAQDLNIPFNTPTGSAADKNAQVASVLTALELIFRLSWRR